MALKNYTGKIYELLKNCLPDDKKVADRYEEEKLFDSPFYHEFMECELTREIFSEYFTKKLFNCSCVTAFVSTLIPLSAVRSKLK